MIQQKLSMQADHLRLTPVRRVRNPHKECKYKSPRNASLYDASSVRTDSHPGPGQYFVDKDKQHRRQDFRRPHDPVSASQFDFIHAFIQSFIHEFICSVLPSFRPSFQMRLGTL